MLNLKEDDSFSRDLQQYDDNDKVIKDYEQVLAKIG